MNGQQGLIDDAIRKIFSWIDLVFYTILDWTYQIFFDVSTVEFFSNETIRNFFSRIQLILGVFMVFKITISILQAIVNPYPDKGQADSFSAYIKRIVICLIMLTILVPRNIPNAEGEYQIQINNNGLLFGTLYSLQGRILKNNTLGKLILGKENDVIDVADDGDNQGNQQAITMKEMGRDFTKTIVKGFVQPNANCNDFDGSEASKIYNNDDTDLNKLFDNINYECGNHNYAFYYYPIVGAVVAAVFAFILVGFTIDIAVRALKIAILRLIAPIPIISYLDPKQEQKGAFANWVKILISTYLDLFVRLAIVFFVVFLITDIRENGIIIGTETSGPMKVIVYIAICIGLFFFAKQAPKFIKDALGLQGGMSNIGLGSLLGGAAMAVGGGGLAGFGYGAMNGAKGQMDAINQGKSVPLMGAWSSNRDLMEKIRTGDKDAQGGAWGRAQDFLNYKTRSNALKDLGMTPETLAQAKYSKDVAEERATDAQRNLAFRQQQLAQIQANRPAAGASQADINNYNTELDNALKEYKQAYKDNEAKQGALAKAAKTADQMEKTMAQGGIAPRMIDTKQESYRSAEKVVTAKRYYDMKGNPLNSTVLTKDQAASYEKMVDEGTARSYDRAVDKNGNYINTSDAKETGKIQYKKDVKGFNGIIDDSPFSGSYGTGANNGGGHSGPTGGRH